MCDEQNPNVLMKRNKNDGMSKPDAEALPDESDLLNVSDDLIYSSSIEDQTYAHLYEWGIPKDAPTRYVELAVYHNRREGVGTTPLKHHYDDDITADPASDGDPVPQVWTVTGSVTITHTDDHSDDMLTHEIETEFGTFSAFGSLENYHPVIQAHMQSADKYEISEAWVSMIQVENIREEDGSNPHICQIARQSGTHE